MIKDPPKLVPNTMIIQIGPVHCFLKTTFMRWKIRDKQREYVAVHPQLGIEFPIGYHATGSFI